MKKIEELLRHIPVLEKTNWDGTVKVSKIEKDSRKIEAGDMFVAFRGAAQDGHDYISTALQRGAVAVIYEKGNVKIPANVVGVRVTDAQTLFPELLKREFDFQDESLKLIGVTGTNGKTTITQLLYQLISQKELAGCIGTINYHLPSGVRESSNTTPGPETLIPLLAEMVADKVHYVAMEVSSHALMQQRVAGLHFDLAIFTQLTQDHLDYHKDLEDYFQAKRKLFSELHPKKMLINRDCPYGLRLLQEFPLAKSFSIETEADYQAVRLSESLRGSRFGLLYRGRRVEFEIALPLRYNISNCTAVLAGLDLLGFNVADFVTALAAIPYIPGRMERVPHPVIDIFVDYAHTPDAFIQVLFNVRKLNPKRIITVFGCGGDRDKGKRPLMTRAAVYFSDVVILTSDNPRSENPTDILNDMKVGVGADDRTRIQVIEMLDRK